MNRSITDLAHDRVRPHLRPGDLALDATAGHGHDALFLAQCVGPAGRVFAFDVQPLALDRTAARLAEAGLSNVELVLRSHAEMAEAIPAELHGKIAAAMFNLGHLPGAGRASVRTEAASSVAAVAAAARLLRPGGCLSLIAYVGHPGGREEAEAVEAALPGLPLAWDCVTPGGTVGPRLWFGVKHAARPDSAAGGPR